MNTNLRDSYAVVICKLAEPCTQVYVGTYIIWMNMFHWKSFVVTDQIVRTAKVFYDKQQTMNKASYITNCSIIMWLAT